MLNLSNELKFIPFELLPLLANSDDTLVLGLLFLLCLLLPSLPFILGGKCDKFFLEEKMLDFTSGFSTFNIYLFEKSLGLINFGCLVFSWEFEYLFSNFSFPSENFPLTSFCEFLNSMPLNSSNSKSS